MMRGAAQDSNLKKEGGRRREVGGVRAGAHGKGRGIKYLPHSSRPAARRDDSPYPKKKAGPWGPAGRGAAGRGAYFFIARAWVSAPAWFCQAVTRPAWTEPHVSALTLSSRSVARFRPAVAASSATMAARRAGVAIIAL